MTVRKFFSALVYMGLPSRSGRELDDVVCRANCCSKMPFENSLSDRPSLASVDKDQALCLEWFRGPGAPTLAGSGFHHLAGNCQPDARNSPGTKFDGSHDKTTESLGRIGRSHGRPASGEEGTVVLRARVTRALCDTSVTDQPTPRLSKYHTARPSHKCDARKDREPPGMRPASHEIPTRGGHVYSVTDSRAANQGVSVRASSIHSPW